jgi:sodium-dependent dicarboxylate transporter 2/3/5
MASPSLLNWQTIHSKMPWSLVLLLGGGFALAKATKVSGLSMWLGKQLEVLDFLPTWALVLVLCLGTAAATEITSNVATCSILMPVLKNLAVALQINPLYLMLPVTLTCSYAFMLPVATPPNAIVYSASGMKTTEMVFTIVHQYNVFRLN